MTRPVSALKGLGPKSEQMLAAAGIPSEQVLASMGSVRAFIAVKQSGQPASLNLLWGMEAALTGRRWQDVAREDRLRLLTELEVACRAAGIRL